MKKNNWSRFIVCVLAIAMIATSLGLGFAEGSLLPYEGETVKIKAFAADVGVTELPDGKGTQVIKNYLGNIEIEWELPPFSDYDTKIALYMNSGDIPDLIWVRAQTTFATYADAGLFADCNQYLDAMPNFKAASEKYPFTHIFTNSSGELVLLPDIQNDFVGEGFFANKTLLDQHGIAVPTNLAEFEAACEALKAADPNITPFHTFWGLSYYEYAFGSAIDARADEFYDHTAKKYAHPLLDPVGTKFKDLTMMLADYYQRGFFNQEFMTMSDDQTKALIATGNWGFTYTYQNQIYAWYGETDNKAALPIEFVPMMPPAPEGTKSRINICYISDNPAWAYGVSAATANPELLCAVVDSVYSDTVANVLDWGVKDFSFTVDENGEKQWIDSFLAAGDDARKDAGVWNVLLPRYVRMVDNNSMLRKTDEQSKEMIRMYTAALQDGTVYSPYDPYAPKFTDDEKDERSAIITPVKTVVDEGKMKFILGDRPLAEWDQFIGEALNAGDVARYIEIANTAEQGGDRPQSSERTYLVP